MVINRIVCSTRCSTVYDKYKAPDACEGKGGWGGYGDIVRMLRQPCEQPVLPFDGNGGRNSSATAHMLAHEAVRSGA